MAAKGPATTRIKATSYTVFGTLKNKDDDTLDLLDFSDFLPKWGITKLNQLFPTLPKCGNLDPPPEYLIKGELIRKWRNFSQLDQNKIIEKYEMGRNRNNMNDTRNDNDDGKKKRKKKKKAKVPIMATSYTLFGTLRKKDAAELDLFDYTDFIDKWGVEKLDELYPKDPNCGKLDPPPPYLVSGKMIRQWRAIGKVDQRHIVKQWKEAQQRKDEREAARKRAEGEYGQSSSVSEAAPNGESINNTIESPPNKKKRGRPAGDSSKADTSCKGITMATIRTSKEEDREALQKGFFHLVGNAYKTKGDILSDTKQWGHDATIAGFLLDDNLHLFLHNKNNKDKNSDDNNNLTTNNNAMAMATELKYSWKCIQTATNQWKFQRIDCNNNNPLPSSGSAKKKKAKKNSSRKRKCCEVCSLHKDAFFELCRTEVLRRWMKKGGLPAVQI